MEYYSLWVGGAEINDNHLTKEEAEFWQGVYLAQGYDDVQIEEMSNVQD
jgi:hypothetical protein